MPPVSACLLLPLGFAAALAKYVHVDNQLDWHNAQHHCRNAYTDMAPVSSEHDTELLRALVDPSKVFWIGLTRSSTDQYKWLWSGGREVSFFFWEEGQPQNQSGEDYGLVTKFKWHDAEPHFLLSFMCFRAIAVRERKTWLEAVDHCRVHHGDLASVASDTEAVLLRKELAKGETTGLVWIGLRFFPGSWLWTDGQPAAGYNGWGPDGEPACPHVQLGCGALRAAAGTKSDETTLLSGVYNLLDGSAGNDWAAGEPVWEAHACEDRLYFICY